MTAIPAVFVHDGQAIPATITSTPELIAITTDDFPHGPHVFVSREEWERVQPEEAA